MTSRSNCLSIPRRVHCEAGSTNRCIVSAPRKYNAASSLTILPISSCAGACRSLGQLQQEHDRRKPHRPQQDHHPIREEHDLSSERHTSGVPGTALRRSRAERKWHRQLWCLRSGIDHSTAAGRVRVLRRPQCNDRNRSERWGISYGTCGAEGGDVAEMLVAAEEEGSVLCKTDI